MLDAWMIHSCPRTTRLSLRDAMFPRDHILSLRSTQMKQITNEMLSVDMEQMWSICREQEEFLLEPLEDAMAVQDVDSIYRHCTTRAERYAVFAQSMQQRLQSVRDPSVRQVLTVLSEFVLSHE
jgi:hypothetical protein